MAVDKEIQYIKRIVELERRLEAKITPIITPNIEKEVPHPPSLELKQAQEHINSLNIHIQHLTEQLDSSQTLLISTVTELKQQQELVFRLSSQLKDKEKQVSGLLESLARLESRVMSQTTYPESIGEDIKKAVEGNRELMKEVSVVQGKSVAMRLRIEELEAREKWRGERSLGLWRCQGVEVRPREKKCPIGEGKQEICGVQLDFTQLHRKYIRLRDQLGTEESLATALGHIQLLEENLSLARQLVAQFRLDIEQVLGWRVELCGKSLFLTLISTGMSLELVREGGYRAVPGSLLRKGLEMEGACRYVTQARSWPGFLAYMMLTSIDDSLQD